MSISLALAALAAASAGQQPAAPADPHAQHMPQGQQAPKHECCCEDMKSKMHKGHKQEMPGAAHSEHEAH